MSDFSTMPSLKGLWQKITGKRPAHEVSRDDSGSAEQQVAPITPDQTQDEFQEICEWLSREGLTQKGGEYELNGKTEADDLLPPDSYIVLGLPSQRSARKGKEELKHLKQEKGNAFTQALEQRDRQKMWQESRNSENAIRELNIQRMPADALAFYRPFHYPPYDQWGIYLLVGRLLRYQEILRTSLGKLHTFSPETLAGAVLFEVFHHEFFHHLVEATATTIEILYASLENSPCRLYLDYRSHQYEATLGEHPHKPLEEALANAYAYNSFSFMSRVKVGYQSIYVSLYQKALEKCWPREPAGYRAAGHYIKGSQRNGAKQLLAQLLGTKGQPCGVPLGMLAEKVFPSGHAAFFAKPDIPTYLVGTENELTRLDALIPAPNETYTSLFWPGNTTRLDDFIQRKKRIEREAKKQAKKQAKKHSEQQFLF